jgi:glycoside hydrolase-like protein/LysM domain-containing protein
VALHGLDRDGAPDPGVAKKMLEDIGGTWWNVYMGGPESGGSGWTPGLLRQYKDHGITHFLLSYVGRQSGHVSRLTVSQGEQDGAEACQLAAQFGFAAVGTPVCLDLEGRTFDAAPAASLDYAGGWCHAVRSHRFRAGVYSNPRALIPLHERASRPDWVWVASWIKHTADSGADPHKASGVTDDLWPGAGQRAWQYAGTFGDGTCSLRGLSVDIDVADSSVLVSSGATVTGPTQDPGHHPVPHTYTVRPGDTLSGIAAKFHTPGGWEAIFRLNRGVIGPNPDLLSPGQVLKLP